MGISVLSPSSYGPACNLLHNGAMQIVQRSAQSNGLGGYPYLADRWSLVSGSAGTWTMTIETDGPAGSGFTKSLKATTNGLSVNATSGFAVIQQAIEGQFLQHLAKGTASAQSLTLSFWVKGSTTGNYVAELEDGTNGRFIGKTFNIASAGTWEFKSLTFAGDTTGTIANSTAAGLKLNCWLYSGTDLSSGTLQSGWQTTTANRVASSTDLGTNTNYLQITGVQLEVGSVASAFEFKPYDMELAECQRYYTTGVTTGVTAINSDNGICNAVFPVQMRVTPTVGTGPSSPGFRGYDTIGGGVYAASAGLTNTGFYYVKPNTSNTLPSTFTIDYTATADY